MYLTGFADEAAADIDGQISAIKHLGWRNIEARSIDGVNITELSDAQFDELCAKLDEAGVMVNCFGSMIADETKPLSASANSSYDELKRAIPRMRRLETHMIRVMSFAVPAHASVNDPDMVVEVSRRMRELVTIAETAGITLVHENGNCWGGLSLEHTLRLVEALDSPNFKLVFDTGNPIFHQDVRGEPPFSLQNSWEFYCRAKPHIAYIRIKDGKVFSDKMRFTFPGEGDGSVKKILADLYRSGYDGGIAIEPHLALISHPSTNQTDASIRFNNFVEYGLRTEKLCREAGWKVFK